MELLQKYYIDSLKQDLAQHDQVACWVMLDIAVTTDGTSSQPPHHAVTGECCDKVRHAPYVGVRVVPLLRKSVSQYTLFYAN